MISRLLFWILGFVGLATGLPFLVLGPVIGEPVFLILGAALTAAGAVLMALFLLGRRRHRAWLENASRTQAEVVAARLNPHIRIGSMLAVDLTVRFHGRTHKRRVLLPPTLAVGAGDTIEILYDRGRPERFEAAATVEGRLR